jgi:hypothetical protein
MVFSKPDPGPELAAVTAMQSNHFLLMGLTRSYWDFYMGIGFAGSISMTAEAVLFWMLGSMAKTDAVRLRPIFAVFLVAYLAIAVNSFVNIFYPPVIVEILIASCFGLAILTAKPVAVA